MTRPSRDPGPAAVGSRDPHPARSGLLGGVSVAVTLSVAGLLVVALVTLAVGSGQLPFLSAGGNGRGGSSGGGAVSKTPTPSNVVVVPTPAPGVSVPGVLLYAKDGNIWTQSKGQATQLTTGGNDSMPSFTPDGQNVLFVRTRYVKGLWNDGTGALAYYAMDVPSVMEVPTSGGTPKQLLDGSYHPPGKGQWMAWIREPELAPNGRTLAIATDLPNPAAAGADVVLKLYDLKTGRLTDPGLAEVAPLGHQDPAWRPDGKVLAYVYNNRDGANGVPQIYGYTPATGAAKPISGPGYLHPSWSPDGQYLAATKTTAYGTDIAILNAATGAEVALLTNDGSSWAPVWSPAGDQVAYLHADGQVVDLRLVTLKGAAGAWTAGATTDLTQSAGLDSVSRPGWYIPADEMPVATPASGGSSAAPAGSSPASPSPS